MSVSRSAGHWKRFGIPPGAIEQDGSISFPVGYIKRKVFGDQDFVNPAGCAFEGGTGDGRAGPLGTSEIVGDYDTVIGGSESGDAELIIYPPVEEAGGPVPVGSQPLWVRLTPPPSGEAVYRPRSRGRSPAGRAPRAAAKGKLPTPVSARGGVAHAQPDARAPLGAPEVSGP